MNSPFLAAVILKRCGMTQKPSSRRDRDAAACKGRLNAWWEKGSPSIVWVARPILLPIGRRWRVAPDEGDALHPIRLMAPPHRLGCAEPPLPDGERNRGGMPLVGTAALLPILPPSGRRWRAAPDEGDALHPIRLMAPPHRLGCAEPPLPDGERNRRGDRLS